jgi:hypothetical protein
MPDTTITTDLHQALDIHLDFAAQISLNTEVALDHFTERFDLRLGQVFDAFVWIHARLIQNLAARGPADSINIRETYLYALVSWQVNPCDTCHYTPPEKWQPFPLEREN